MSRKVLTFLFVLFDLFVLGLSSCAPASESMPAAARVPPTVVMFFKFVLDDGQVFYTEGYHQLGVLDPPTCYDGAQTKFDVLTWYTIDNEGYAIKHQDFHLLYWPKVRFSGKCYNGGNWEFPIRQ